MKSEGLSLKVNMSRHDKSQPNFATQFCFAWVWVHEYRHVWCVYVCESHLTTTGAAPPTGSLTDWQFTRVGEVG